MLIGLREKKKEIEEREVCLIFEKTKISLHFDFNVN
jgi:hypothetical protein